MPAVSSIRLLSEESTAGSRYLVLALDRRGNVLARGRYESLEAAQQAITRHFSVTRKVREPTLRASEAPHAAR
jgi:hypothetical protein